MRVYILVQTRLHSSEKILESLASAKVEGLVQAGSVYGWYDAVVELEVPKPEECESAYRLIRSHPDVVHSEILIEAPGDVNSPSLAELPTSK